VKALFASALLLLAGCGLTHHDVTVAQDFQAGGGPPTATTTINSSTLSGQISAGAGDLTKLSSVTMQSAHLTATDSGDLSFVSGCTITLSGNGLPDVTLATLPAAPAAGQSDVALAIGSTADLRAYLAAGGALTAVVTYSNTPVAARALRLTLVLRASL
jgi:hypothetical protein